MKKDIHPKLHNATVRCHCGYESNLVSTLGEEVSTEICSNCHPFYTGKQRFVDTAGRIDRFKKKFGSFDAASKVKGN
ncbi:50S ribosomal protein L31 [Maridesulfovibrio hydrothermalis]|uniref:Large ribosomal subunit protein bL31 n=1 Tax=Maridesulfovibrio hydrothermalis AM13 = DSM 14728 TaxID=1121451 RepID=L0RFK6_9BACT|nr:50S ribosomal protein L31 [Maridesulfovibrio hydrothermalis]CCO24970.1 ribosomal protein L31 [Maridesulfovibrio hydrothermalis AM13 = DSM 14728]